MFGILNDVTKCIGCEECVTACKQRNNLGPDRRWRWTATDGLSSDSWCSILRWPGAHNVRKMCRHCLEPACASACPVAALYRTDEGHVMYREERCMGCRYCMMGCPYGIPRYSWEDTIPLIRKCILCHEQTSAGGQPACAEACPTEATVFGDRDELLRRAHETIEANPDRYQQHVWGEHEVGGTGVLYISDVEMTDLMINPEIGERSLPDMTWPALKPVPYVFVGVGVVSAGLRWFIGRRQKLAEEAAGAKPVDEVPSEEEPEEEEETERKAEGAEESTETSTESDGADADDDDEKASEDS